MTLVHDDGAIAIYHGNAVDWKGPEPISFVFTNPYGPMPASLRDRPMIIHQWVHRKTEAEAWCGNALPVLVSKWNDGREAFWSTRAMRSIDLSAYHPEPGGWYPEPLVRTIFQELIPLHAVVWDGFMGRGTIAKVARDFGCRYVGVEQLSDHIELAKSYLGLDAL